MNSLSVMTALFRTYYELETWNGKQPLCLEEAYDLKLAHTYNGSLGLSECLCG